MNRTELADAYAAFEASFLALIAAPWPAVAEPAPMAEG